MAKRIDFLISNDRYLTAEEKARFEERQREQAGLADTPPPEPSPPEQAQPEPSPEEPAPQAESKQPSAFSMPAATQREVTQADIDAALQEWNGDIESKRAVVRHMRKHARDKETAAFLRAEYGDDLPAFPVTADGAATDVPWPKVQRPHRPAYHCRPGSIPRPSMTIWMMLTPLPSGNGWPRRAS